MPLVTVAGAVLVVTASLVFTDPWLNRAAALVFWPFATLARLPLASPTTELLGLAPAAALLLLLNALWVFRSDAAFEEASAERAEAQARTAGGEPRVRRASPVRVAPFTLAPTGRVEGALLWKNMIAFARVPLWLLIGLLPAVAIAAVAAAGTVPGTATLARASLGMAGAIILIGPASARFDLREDLQRLAVLKGWPVSGATLFRGEVAAVSLLLSFAAGFTVLVAAALSKGAVGDLLGLPSISPLAAAPALIALSAALVTTHVVVQNALVVWLAGVAIYNVSGAVRWDAVAVVAAAILLVECAIAASVAGLALDRLDAGSVGPA